MNLPNKITVARILLIPIFLIVMLFDSTTYVSFLGANIAINHFIGALIFIFASATDWVDGYIARRQNLITNLGKFLDPLADKLLVAAALVVLVEMHLAPAWIVILILSREFAVTGLRLVLAEQGVVVAASNLGKIKTVTQLIAIITLLLHNPVFAYFSFPFATLMLWVALFFTVLSGLDYFWKNKAAFSYSK